MRVLVTGASGFLGRWTLPPLLEQGAHVVAIGRNRPSWLPGSVEWVNCDLLSHVCEGTVASIGADGLLHLAWNTTPGVYWETIENLDWVAASLRLIREFVQGGGRRCVIAGTSAEYDWDNADDLDEISSPILPLKLYGHCKNSLRLILDELFRSNHSATYAWARIFCPFGQFEHSNRIIPKIIRSLISQESIPFDSGLTLRDFLHAKDVGEAFATILTSEVTGPINIASGSALSVRNVAEIISSNINGAGKIHFGQLPDPPDIPKRIVGSVRRLHDEVGWRPQISIESRLAETCDWWKNHLASNTFYKVIPG